MKKILFTIIVMMVMTSGFAQEKVRITFNNGTTTDFNTADIKKFDFYKFDANPEGKEADAIDLGLSVKWASWNLGASSEYESGGYYKWSENLVSQKWGNKWRLPTEKEFKELLDNCTIENVLFNEQLYCKVTSKNGNYIIIPVTGTVWDWHEDFKQEIKKDDIVLLIDGNQRYRLYLSGKSWASSKGSTSSSLLYSIRPVYEGSGGGMNFSISGSPVSLAANAGATGTFTIDTNFDFTIRNDNDWLEVTPTKGNTTTKVTVKAKTANPSTSERTAKIYVSNMLIGAAIVEIKQAAGTSNILFAEPYLNWGAPKSMVRSVLSERGYILMGESTSADGTIIPCIAPGKQIITQYVFSSTQQLYYVLFFFRYSEVSPDELRTHLSSKLGCLYQGTATMGSENVYVYTTSDGKSYVLVSYTTDASGEKVTLLRYVDTNKLKISSRQTTRSADGSGLIIDSPFKLGEVIWPGK